MVSFSIEVLYNFPRAIILKIKDKLPKKQNKKIEDSLYNMLEVYNSNLSKNIKNIETLEYKDFIMEKYFEEFIYNKDEGLFTRFKKQWESLKFYRSIVTLLMCFIVFTIGVKTIGIFFENINIIFSIIFLIISFFISAYAFSKYYKEKADLILYLYLELIEEKYPSSKGTKD